ncbi:MAG TPA: substrate-binding domain-containing protein [Candidatus Limnocylindria bacterium]|nr:substrate-binding domain-containing protein [Candidatus Limnocylindria bacterium]
MSARSRARRVLPGLALLLVVTSGCAPAAPAASPSAEPQGSVLVGTTTTTQDTGLLDVLLPDFERRTGWKVKLVVGGSGQILRQAQRGDLDVILTHSPPDEEAFMKAGYGSERRLVMHNDFVLLGPVDDPARIKGQSVGDALRRIYDASATFVSRGDRSGTNVKELSLWSEAGRDPKGKPWYLESGTGQLQNLQLAVTRKAYTLSDRGTWLANRPQLRGLDVLVEGGHALLNIYHVILFDPARFPKVEQRGARAFADYLVGPDGQKVIATYGVQKYGQSTFTADAGKNEDDLE